MAAYDNGRNLYIAGGLLLFGEKDDAYPTGYKKPSYFGKSATISLSLEKETIEEMDTEGCEPTLDGEYVTKRSARINITTK